jgi:hypothetical protein
VCPSLIYALLFPGWIHQTVLYIILCDRGIVCPSLIYAHGHTKLYIEQFDDTNGVIIGRKSEKDRQCHGHTKLDMEEFDHTNE